MESLLLAGIGLILGITTVVPGVSAGTLAVVFNVYDRLLEVITPNIRKIIGAWRFLLPLGLGGLVGIFLFSKLAAVLFSNHPFPTYWFFIGIIAGSIPFVYGKVCPPRTQPPFSTTVCIVVAFALMLVMAILKPTGEMPLYTDLTPGLFALLVAAGMLAAFALIIPGTSGSFMLFVVGLYRTIVHAVNALNIPVLASFAFGTLAGLLLGAALVRSLLAKAPAKTYGAVLGLMAGSLVVLYPNGLGSGLTIVISIASLVSGFALSFVFGRHKK